MINMLNEGDSTAQLIFRHWRIHDAAGDDSLVDGEGVVGQQPVLAPGDSHEYKSYCVLRSPVGFMEGYYTFIRSSGAEFRVEVPRFHLNGPLVLPASIQDHDLDEETGGPIH
jgi:ApaG protein